MATILENVQGVKARIARAARAAGRAPESVTLLAVSKTHASARIVEARAAGLTAFGENYVQEALQKMDALSGAMSGVEWHLVGPLQSNKTRAAAERFDWVQTIDRAKTASRLSEQRPAQLPPLNVLIQVNISGEATKSGVGVKEVTALAAAIAGLPRLRLRGLMAIPAPDAPGAFTKMNELYQDLRPRFGFDTLSMGMSDDMDAAIAAGATMVRIGTAIFGQRSPERSAA